MQIRMRTTAAGPRGVFVAGQVVDVAETQARAWVDGGYAEPVVAPKAAAAVADPEPEPIRVPTKKVR